METGEIIREMDEQKILYKTLLEFVLQQNIMSYGWFLQDTG